MSLPQHALTEKEKQYIKSDSMRVIAQSWPNVLKFIWLNLNYNHTDGTWMLEVLAEIQEAPLCQILGFATESQTDRDIYGSPKSKSPFSKHAQQMDSALSSISLNVEEILGKRLFHHRQILTEGEMAVLFFLRKKI